jgi:nitrogen fixation NifU-like protein
MNNYNKKVLKYFLNPKNRGKIKSFNGVGMVGNPVCGDLMKIYIKVSKDEIIENIGFETLGCVAAVASSSITTEMAKGKSLKQALKIKKNDIVKELEGLPKEKIHCSVLANQALKKAIENYYSKKLDPVSSKRKNKL